MVRDLVNPERIKRNNIVANRIIKIRTDIVLTILQITTGSKRVNVINESKIA